MSIQSFETQNSLAEISISELQKDNEPITIDSNFNLTTYIENAKYHSSTDVIGYIKKVSKLSKFIKEININDSVSIQREIDTNTVDIDTNQNNPFTLNISIDDSFDLSDKEYPQIIIADEDCSINDIDEFEQ